MIDEKAKELERLLAEHLKRVDGSSNAFAHYSSMTEECQTIIKESIVCFRAGNGSILERVTSVLSEPNIEPDKAAKLEELLPRLGEAAELATKATEAIEASKAKLLNKTHAAASDFTQAVSARSDALVNEIVKVLGPYCPVQQAREFAIKTRRVQDLSFTFYPAGSAVDQANGLLRAISDIRGRL
jgi:vacuolar-type H+-ATPase subunit I/STV1